MCSISTLGEGLEEVPQLVEHLTAAGPGSLAIWQIFDSLRKQLHGRFEEHWVAAATLTETVHALALTRTAKEDIGMECMERRMWDVP